ncbi:transmembrane protein 134 isoform X3 [Ascaphus truei]|uniref:transmembrane protein 134 isoform X3 n=1 Tax=Ascaphus truei TaxID=8439 RepID=UPI003F5A7E13
MANFTIDDAFEMSLEESGSKYGALHFGGDPEIQQSRLKYKNLENDEDTEKAKETERGLPPLSFRSSQCSFSTISNSTQLSYRECFSWTRHPLIQKNKKVVIYSFLLLLLGLDVSSAIFFVPGFLLLIPGVYHVIFIYCAVRGRRGFQFFYLPYFDK